MNVSRARGRRRTYRWEGVVHDVDGSTVHVRLEPADHRGPDLFAEFTTTQIVGARPGHLFHLYTHRRGRKLRYVLRAVSGQVYAATVSLSRS